MANEPIQGLPYPLPSDTNDPPRDIKALADAAVTRTNMRFATTGARDAALTSPSEGMECFIGTGATASKQIYRDSGWKDAAPRVASGRLTITPSASGVATLGKIVFPTGRFSGTPTVTATAMTTSFGTATGQVAGVGVLNVTPTGADVYLTRHSTAGTEIAWTAIQNP